MSGTIIFRSGGPITWKTEHQEQTSLSSCDAEICTTAMGSCRTINTRNLILHLKSLGYPINDADMATPLYNANNACVKWCHNLTTQGYPHIEHRENVTWEWVETVASLSHTSMANAIPPTFSLRKCATVQAFDASETPSCHGLPTSSAGSSILSTLCRPLLLSMLLNAPIMSHPCALACLTSSFPNLCFALRFRYHA